nr:PREDICTED: delta-sarcoglycan [Latimeria chalumnae]|eukprot:XP_014342181.1 PREDICTED: delta-sarcoglycan [Latimeria chalumnae]
MCVVLVLSADAHDKPRVCFISSSYERRRGRRFGSQLLVCDFLCEMAQEQYPHGNNVQSSEGPHVYKVGIYGWRKRCLYFFVLLLMVLILLNLAMTIWILKVMNFTIDGMGHLRITEEGLKLEGDSEFLKPLYAKEIHSRADSPLYLQSSRNVSVNILSSKNEVLTRLLTGAHAVEAHSKRFEVVSTTGNLLFSADDSEVVVGAERIRVVGSEGAVFSKSLETPHIRADPFKELRLESLTRSLIMEAPKGIALNAEAGNIEATCQSQLKLESKEGELIKGSQYPQSCPVENFPGICRMEVP